MSLFQTTLYEILNEKCNLLYPGKNIQTIIFHFLVGDNYNKGKVYSLNSEESIFSPNHINEESGDYLVNWSSLDDYNKKINFQFNIFSVNQIKEKLGDNIFNLSLFDNYIEGHDDSLISTDDTLSINLNFINSKNNIDNPLKKAPDIPLQNEISTDITSKKDQINESKKFSITLRQKRGRKTIQSNEISHDSSSDDNCLRKIQNHFFNFIINLTNEVLIKENIKEDFKFVDYKIKSNVNHDFFCKLKVNSIKNLLEMDISPKYKSKTSDYNRETLNKIEKKKNYQNLLNFFSINYLELFSVYHNNEKPLLKFDFNGEEIELKKAKSFYYLLNNKNNKGKKITKDLSNIAKRFFIDDNSSLNKRFFQTKETINLKE
jgi:hypothetical protein